MNKISLNGTWDLYYAPEKGGKHERYLSNIQKNWKRIQGSVPGNVQLDLVNAGILPDPFYGDHLHRFVAFEYTQWLYVRTFEIPSEWRGEQVILHFDGLDDIADIYVNDHYAASAANMFVEHEVDITPFIRWDETNELIVHIHSAMNEARKHAYTIGMRGTARRNEICWLRKAPHSFGWDIAPRLVTAGLWRGVWLERRKQTRILETYYACSKLGREGIELQYACRFATDHDTLEGFEIRVVGQCGSSVFERREPAHFISMNYTTVIKEPLLWWPKGSGDANLYEVRMELLYHGNVVDAVSERIGLRTFRLERCFEPGQQRFRMWVNEKPIFIKGTNWVPLDAMHCRDAERLAQAHRLVSESGCNMLRCWGGNVYEDHAFFDLCDEQGIMVWQDFAMGNTNYPQTQAFYDQMEEEAEKVITKIRNHPSLVLWCSDNEIDYKNEGFNLPNRDSAYNRIAYELLPRMIQAHDPYRILIKSSPEIPEGFHMYNVPEQHRWGARAWYKDDFYRNINACFVSEYGFHGCPAPSSIRRFIPEEYLWTMDNHIWAMHSTEDIRIEPSLNGRNIMMANHVRLMYGQAPEDLDEFALLSQMYQGEAMKYQIERCRMQKWNKTGILWWNMLDCWPQISDSVVDYYFCRKLAYHYIRRVQVPVAVMMGDLDGWNYPVWASNDTFDAVTLQLTIADADSGECVLKGEWQIAGNEAERIANVPGFASDQKMYLIRWTVNGQEYGNHFLTGAPPYRAEDMKRWLESIRRLPEPFEYEG